MKCDNTSHFQGFANRLWLKLVTSDTFHDKLGKSSQQRGQEMVDIISKAAYAIAYHTLYCARVDPELRGNVSPLFEQELREQLAEFVPDLTEWTQGDAVNTNARI